MMASAYVWGGWLQQDRLLHFLLEKEEAAAASQGPVKAYARYCLRCLEDDTMASSSSTGALEAPSLEHVMAYRDR